jgi:flagellar hook-length control protein FliK
MPAAHSRGPAQGSLSAPLNPSQLSERVRDLLRTTGDGRVEVKLRLDPPELGTVRLRVVASGDSVTVQLVARTPEAVAALDRRLPELEHALAQNGTHLAQASVDLEDTGSGPRERMTDGELAGPPPATRPVTSRAPQGTGDARRPVSGPGSRLDVIA